MVAYCLFEVLGGKSAFATPSEGSSKSVRKEEQKSLGGQDAWIWGI